MRQQTRQGLAGQHKGVIAVQRGRHRHPCAGAGGHRRRLGLVPQFVKHDHIRGKTSHRAADALRLGITQQHVASRQGAGTAEFLPLIHHRHPISPRRQTDRQIPQEGGLAR